MSEFWLLEETQPDIQPFLSHGSLRSKTWHLSWFGLHVEVTLPEWFPVDHLIAFSLASSGYGRGGNAIESCEETEAHCFLLAELEHTLWSLCAVMRLQPCPVLVYCCDHTCCQKDAPPAASLYSVFSGGFLNLGILRKW